MESKTIYVDRHTPECNHCSVDKYVVVGVRLYVCRSFYTCNSPQFAHLISTQASLARSCSRGRFGDCQLPFRWDRVALLGCGTLLSVCGVATLMLRWTATSDRLASSLTRSRTVSLLAFFTKRSFDSLRLTKLIPDVEQETTYLAAATSDCHATAVRSSGSQLRRSCDDSTSLAREIAPVAWSPNHPSEFVRG